MECIDVNSESKNAYDIQELCVDTASMSLEKMFLQDGVNLVKTYAFNNGTYLSSYGRLIGVIVRDRYFEAKGINKDEVDQYDPLVKK